MIADTLANNILDWGVFVVLIFFAFAVFVSAHESAGRWRSRWRGEGPPRQIEPAELRTLEQLLMLTPTEFELAVGDLMKEMGFRRVRRIGGAGDLAVDVTARDSEGRTVAVQCKRYTPSATVGSPEIQKFIGMTTTHHLTDRAIFVTTASYTKPAAELARHHNIELWDGARLAELLTQYRGHEPATKEKPGFSALGRAGVKLAKREARDAKRAAAIAAEQESYRYEHTSSIGIHIPDAALDLARESAAARALLRRHPDREPTEEEIDELVRGGAPKQTPKRCEDCGGQMQWHEVLPGHYCPQCARIELWIADERKVLSPRSKKRARRLARR